MGKDKCSKKVTPCCGSVKPAPKTTCQSKPNPCQANSVSPCSANKKEPTSSGSLAYFDNMVGNCLEYAQKAKKAGKKVVGIFCEYTPRELIMAAGGIPVCMCGGTEETIPSAEEDLPANLCPLIKSSYGYAKMKVNPLLEISDLIVAETTCDGKKKMYELLSKYKPMYVLELPQKSDDPDALTHWKAEIRKFKAYLEKEFKTKITDDKLRNAIKVMNTERRLRLEIASLAGRDNPLLTGMQVLMAKSLISGIPDDFRMYEKIIKESEAKLGNHAGRPRILLTGVPMPHEAEKVMRIIEDAGGVVVAQESCTGVKPLDLMVSETGDPLDAIAEKYFHLPCSVMTTNDKRFNLLDKLIKNYKPQGVIELVWQGCHTYNIEAFLVQKHIEQKHRMPYLKLETDYSPSDSSQLKVRIQALLEIIKNK